MALAGVGTAFQRESDTTSGTYEAISEVNSISGPTMSRSTIDTTSLDSIGGYRTFITSFRDPGTVTLNMNFDRDTYDIMLDDFDSDTSKNYRIVLNDAGNTTFNFTGFVTELPLDIPTDDKVTANVTIKVTGQVTFTS
jgi:predicted secreted protein